ncbi:signal peptidase II [Gorillibacterium massiliense]|uniref:signal peptidase II n=1 Tax=Gorillibacterium massiliense TaxID=1280390 RepID=UPI0004AE4EC8|nr:signal peptidase II [Gorillibacterium massiliense]
MIYFIVALIAFLLDQFTKWLIVQNLDLYELVPVIGHFFQITSHRNTGAAFSILEGERWFFVVITVIVVCGLLWYMRKVIREGRRLMPTALAFILGGALGNFVDRARHGEVVDFLQFHFRFTLFSWHVDYIFPIFNIADTFITIGVAMILLDSILDWRKEKKAGPAELDQAGEKESETHGS